MKKTISIIIVAIMVLCLSACGSRALALNEPTEVGTWEINIKKIQFARQILNRSFNTEVTDYYNNLLVPNGQDSSSEGLDQGEVFAVVTYTMKNIGKESTRIWNSNTRECDGVGRFVYGDGYIFDSNDYDRIPSPYVFSGESLLDMPYEYVLDPLSSEVECRIYFVLPEEAVTNTDESLFYEITINESGKDKTIRFEVPDRSIIE